MIRQKFSPPYIPKCIALSFPLPSRSPNLPTLAIEQTLRSQIYRNVFDASVNIVEPTLIGGEKKRRTRREGRF